MSRNDYDWLGHGIYFFEHAPARAADWAVRQHGENASVVEAEIELRDCLDLTDLPGVRRLRPYYRLFYETYGREKLRELRQGPGRRELDCTVINFACEKMRNRGEIVRVVREAFSEGAPLWEDPEGQLPSSGINERNHVHLAVRDSSVIGELSIADNSASKN